MKRFTLRLTTHAVAVLAFLAVSCHDAEKKEIREKEETEQEAEMEDEEHEGYDGPMERALLEIEKTKDPALGYVPVERLWNAVEYSKLQKQNYRGNSILAGIWEERGPSFDSVGPSNGNNRGVTKNEGYTSGRIRAVLVDAFDPTGNTVFTGGVDGGLWKCTNFLSNTPNWQAINDYFDNMAISYICQDPSNTSVMYFCTGEPTANADAVLGRGVWKSTDRGATWNNLPSTIGFTRGFRILCDNSGNVYLATRSSAGLYRSTDGGATWLSITPGGASTSCTDIEISSTGKLHASFGYGTGTAGTACTYVYTTTPATVTSTTWSSGTGLPTSGINRIELATKGDTLYAAPTNGSNNLVSTYRSVDGGANWAQNNTANYPTGVSNTQGWYNITLDINPDSAEKIIVGGLDAYRSADTGKTVQRFTYWVNTTPYVHADHHFSKWWKVGNEKRILFGTDGGLFLSRDNGATWKDKNLNLNIKQFYSIAVHPTTTNYFLAGAQDNGSHQLTQPGLSYSTEVTGGDGAFVDIDQVNPQYQFTSYTFNQYRRSINGGANWSSFNFSNSAGRFINPFTYDGVGQKLYACNGAGVVRRWENPTTATSTATSTTTLLTVAALNSTSPSAFIVSPNVPNRLYVGTGNGRLIYIDNADTVSQAVVNSKTTNITGTWGTAVYVSSIAVGKQLEGQPEPLAIVMSNYGVNNVYYSADGGTTWSAIDGNLPDMPVRWVLFNPANNDQLIIATEAGVYTTANVNGAATLWTISPGFPTVRTDMLKYRPSDGLVAAATHGRGIFTTTMSQVLPIRDVSLSGNLAGDGIASLNWITHGEDARTRYVLQYSTDGVVFDKIAELPYGVKQYRHSFQAAIGYYRIMAIEPSQAAVFSNIVSVNNNSKVKGIQVRIAPNPIVGSAGSFIVSSSEAGKFSWSLFDLQGRTLQNGNGTLTAGGSQNQAINTGKLASGMYRIRLVQGNQTVVTSFTKQ